MYVYVQYMPMETAYSEIKMDAVSNYRPSGTIKVCVMCDYVCTCMPLCLQDTHALTRSVS